MVYNRDGMPARITFLKDHLPKGQFRKRSFDETLYAHTDGFSARYYPRDQFEDLFRAFFKDVSCEIMGQDAGAVPLPQPLRRLALPLFSRESLAKWQARRGAFLILRARNPF
jgi:hypothetical protein